MIREPIKLIDISKWNTVSDWKKVKADGVKAVMIRCGIGANNTVPKKDSKFDIHIQECINNSIPVGVYLYSYAKSAQKSKTEAQYVIEWLKPYRNHVKYPVAYDIEDKSQANLSKDVISGMCSVFCNEVKIAGYHPMIYASLDWLKNKINPETVAKWPIWLAQWGPRVTFPAPVDIWQYSDKGKIDGISGYVDLNWCYRDYQ